MNNQEIYQKIEKLYNEEKSKNFIIHLMRNFFPTDKTSALFFKVMKNDKEVELKCCITGKKLYSKEAALEIFLKNSDEIVKNRFDSMIASINDRIQPELLESEKELQKTISSLALTSKTSDKYICKEAYQELFNFWASEILKGNKHLNWVAKNQHVKEVLGDLEKKKKITPLEKNVVMKSSNNAKLSLGDIEVLKNLKKKFDNE